jgi:hypothetical protein
MREKSPFTLETKQTGLKLRRHMTLQSGSVGAKCLHNGELPIAAHQGGFGISVLDQII